MNTIKAPLISLCASTTVLGGMVAGVRADSMLPPRLYAVSIETGMPHLEENLRYSVTHSRICLGDASLATVFPVLREAVLSDCRLMDAHATEPRTRAFTLHCTGNHGTQGEARWQLDSTRLLGTLSVKLGGKNMTFYQRITAWPLAGCGAASDGWY